MGNCEENITNDVMTSLLSLGKTILFSACIYYTHTYIDELHKPNQAKKAPCLTILSTIDWNLEWSLSNIGKESIKLDPRTSSSIFFFCYILLFKSFGGTTILIAGNFAT